MPRNWGIPQKPGAAFVKARSERPFATLGVSVVYGIIGAAIAAMSFNEARGLLADLYRGLSLIAAVVAAGFGCWAYVWLARPRFAAHFTGAGDAFSDVLRFYVFGTIGLAVLIGLAKGAELAGADMISALILCVCGGAGAAAAFQTVLAFVPNYRAG